MSQITDELLAKLAWTAVQSACEWDDRTSPDGYEDYMFLKPDEMHQVLVSFFETVASTPPVGAETGEDKLWRTMDSAPLDGKHCILAVPEPGGFIYSVQGAYQDGRWNAVHRDNVQPLYWMPNIRLPAEWQHVHALTASLVSQEAGE